MEYDAIDLTLPENKRNIVPDPSAGDSKVRKDVLGEQNKRKELHFKASHGLLIGFFLWILYAVRHH